MQTFDHLQCINVNSIVQRPNIEFIVFLKLKSFKKYNLNYSTWQLVEYVADILLGNKIKPRWYVGIWIYRKIKADMQCE